MKVRYMVILLAVILALPVTGLQLSRKQSGRITQLVGRILSVQHLRQARLDDRLSQIFLENYFDALDFSHQVFLQGDIDEFTEDYATALDDLTLAGNAEPAQAIYDRYLERLERRHEQISELLTQEYDFTLDEEVQLSRSEEAWPKNDEEARQLWHNRVKYEILQGRLQDEDHETIIKRLEKRYGRLLKNMRELESDEVLQIYLTALSNAYDPHSDYMSPPEAENFTIHNVKLSLDGIGALLRSEDGYCTIVSLVPGGPAALSGELKPNDKIVEVAQGEDEEAVDVVEERLNKVVNLIRGKRGTDVVLTVVSAESNERKKVKLVRDQIQLKEQFAKARVVELSEDSDRRLGIIDLPQYYENSARDVRRILQRLNEEDVDGVVLDLRRNGGGILSEAVDLTGLFVPDGPVVQVKDFQDDVTILEDKNSKTYFDGPVVVLVSNLSASASEITAAALQDYGRAIVVGDKATHGKGTVQTLMALKRIRLAPPEAGMLKYTISKFYRISGTTTQKYGVSPDITLPSIYDYMELGEAHLPNSLEADEIRPAGYDKQGRVQPWLATLTENSAARISGDQDFAYVLEDIERYRERKEKETVSLNESVRREERQQNKDRAEQRKNEQESRDPKAERIYSISLSDIAEKQAMTLVYPPSDNGEAPEKDQSGVDNADDKPVASGVPSLDDSGDSDQDADDKIDPYLREGLNILNDYIELIQHSTGPDGTTVLVN